MKKLEIITRTFKLEQIKAALSKLGVSGMTVIEVRGFGRQGGHKEIYRGAEYQVDFVPKVKIEVIVNDDILAEAVKTITEAARTGEVGDGKIFVYPVDDAIRIRTGESGPDAV